MSISGKAKKTVNRTLLRVTGYEVRRKQPAKGGAAAPAAKKSPEPPPPAATKSPAAKAPEKFPKDFDEQTVAIIRAVRPFTMTSPDKLHALISATRYVSRYGIEGDVVECGVWRGGSLHAVARTLDSLDDHDRDLYLYDTFDGMTEPTDKDVRFDGQSAAGELAAQDKAHSAVWAYASLEDVQAGFADVPYPLDRVHFVKGPVEETVPGVLPERVSILRLDTDWYESTAHELKHMYDRLVPGGVLLLDDYGWWQGSRVAVDEFLDRTGERLLLIRMGTGRIAVKAG